MLKLILIPHPVTSNGKVVPGPDPRIRYRIQIVMFRPIRVDHTNCLQVASKTHSFISGGARNKTLAGICELDVTRQMAQVTLGEALASGAKKQEELEGEIGTCR
jgi:hypothetical protein